MCLVRVRGFLPVSSRSLLQPGTCAGRLCDCKSLLTAQRCVGRRSLHVAVAWCVVLRLVCGAVLCRVDAALCVCVCVCVHSLAGACVCSSFRHATVLMTVLALWHLVVVFCRSCLVWRCTDHARRPPERTSRRRRATAGR